MSGHGLDLRGSTIHSSENEATMRAKIAQLQYDLNDKSNQHTAVVTNLIHMERRASLAEQRSSRYPPNLYSSSDRLLYCSPYHNHASTVAAAAKHFYIDVLLLTDAQSIPLFRIPLSYYLLPPTRINSGLIEYLFLLHPIKISPLSLLLFYSVKQTI